MKFKTRLVALSLLGNSSWTWNSKDTIAGCEELFLIDLLDAYTYECWSDGLSKFRFRETQGRDCGERVHVSWHNQGGLGRKGRGLGLRNSFDSTRLLEVDVVNIFP